MYYHNKETVPNTINILLYKTNEYTSPPKGSDSSQSIYNYLYKIHQYVDIITLIQRKTI
jgi:hypothetical protein